MVVKGSNEWKKLNREMKILQAKRKAGGLLPKEAQRLEWLEERFGAANEVTRIRLQEDVDDGAPKVTTSDDHWATEVSEDLLEDADKFEAKKAWDKDIKREEAKFQATDSRQGKETFAQEGLSPFAVDLTADFREEGFQDDPVEEEEAAEKQATFGRVNYARMDDEEETAPKGGANPFAVDLDASLAGALGQFDDGTSAVPDTGAKSFEADYGDLDDDEPVDFTTRIDDAPGEVQDLFAQGEPDTDAGLSIGELTTHEAEGDADDGEVDYDLMRAAMDYAEDHDLEDEESVAWGVDDHGQEVEYEEEDGFELPTKSEIPSARARADALIPDPPPAELDDEPRIVGEDGLGVLIPDPRDDDDDEGDPTMVGEADLGVLIPDPPDDGDDEGDPTMVGEGDLGVLIPDAPDANEEATAAEVPDLFAEPEPTVTDEADPGMVEADADVVPDLSDGEVPDLSDGELPDLSDGDEFDVNMDFADSEPTAEPKKGGGYVPPPVPEDDLAYMPEAKPGGAVDPFAAEIDLSEASVAEGSLLTDTESPSGGAPAADEMDSFWGLSDEGGTASNEFDAQIEVAEPETRMDPIPSPAGPLPPPSAPLPPPGRPLPPPPAPGGPKPQGTDRPLPALNLQAAQVAPPAAAPPPRPAGRRDQANEMLQDLFDEAVVEEVEEAVPDDAPAPLEPIIIGPVKKGPPPSRKPRRPQVGRGVSRQPATQSNDLKGPRRATVHFKDGVNRRGLVKKIDHHSSTIVLEPAPGSGGKAEKLNTLALKAVFLLLPKGFAYPQKEGYPCKLMMIDGRTLEGYTPDYDPQAKSFTLFPAQDRGNIERIIVFNEAIKNLWFPEE